MGNESKAPPSPTWEVTELTSESDICQALIDLKGRFWLCRGQPRCYGVLPTIDREGRRGLSRIKKLVLERQGIDLFRSTVRLSPDTGEYAALSDDLVALMLLRQYGVPTRLLDWTFSPYVAAYFSVCENDEDDKVNGEIWAFDERLYEHEGSEQWRRFPETTTDGSGNSDKFDLRMPTAFGVQEPNDWIVCRFYRSYQGFPRHDVQDAAYTFAARFGRDHAEAIAKLLGKPDGYHRYVIKAELKPAVRRMLREKHGIWRGSLFPDVAGAAETANTLFPGRGKEGSGLV